MRKLWNLGHLVAILAAITMLIGRKIVAAVLAAMFAAMKIVSAICLAVASWISRRSWWVVTPIALALLAATIVTTGTMLESQHYHPALAALVTIFGSVVVMGVFSIKLEFKPKGPTSGGCPRGK